MYSTIGADFFACNIFYSRMVDNDNSSGFINNISVDIFYSAYTKTFYQREGFWPICLIKFFCQLDINQIKNMPESKKQKNQNRERPG